MAREDPAHAVAVWEKLSWCDGLSERRLRQAIGAVESRERLLQRGLGDQSLREGLERARQRMAEMETQEHLCAEIGARDFEALSWLEYAVGAGATNAYERAASSLLPRMSRASRIRHAEQLLRIRELLKERLASHGPGGTEQLAIRQAAYRTGIFAPDPVQALAIDHALWLAGDGPGMATPPQGDAPQVIPEHVRRQAMEIGERLHAECCS